MGALVRAFSVIVQPMDRLQLPHDAHDADQAHYLPRLAHDFKVLQKREIQSVLGESVTTTLGS